MQIAEMFSLARITFVTTANIYVKHILAGKRYFAANCSLELICIYILEKCLHCTCFFKLPVSLPRSNEYAFPKHLF